MNKPNLDDCTFLLSYLKEGCVVTHEAVLCINRLLDRNQELESALSNLYKQTQELGNIL